MKKLLLFLMILVNVLVLASCDEDNHTHSFERTGDKNNHWYVCDCGETKDLAAHTMVENTEHKFSYCNVCNCVATEKGFYANIASQGVNRNEVNNAYQVLVYSYYDSNNDGYGDLAGLESKLDYIKGLGVDIIWLSPVMECESYHSYDITSFYKVDSKIGTFDDYLSLVNTAHQKDMKILLDMPINHTSLNHEWFIEYLNGNPEYAEYYQAKKSGVNYGTSSSMASSKFYTASNGKTYFAAFGESMPDLNFQSETLVSAIYDVFDFWSLLGADGYRFDAVKHIFDPNEIPANESSVDLNNQLFQELGAHLKEKYPNMYLLGENYSGQGEILEYAESFDAEFDFETWQVGLGAVTLCNAWGGGNDGRIYFDDAVVYNTNQLIDANPNWIPTFMTGNHDVTRAASYICDKVNDDQEALKLYAAMCTLRQGIPFIYYGDEIGMYGENKSGVNTDVEDSQVRLPMTFADSTIQLTKVFYTVMPNGKLLGQNMQDNWSTWKTDNPVVEEQIADSDSLYNTYKELLAFRKQYPTIALGTMEQHCDYARRGSIISFTYGAETIYVAYNYSEREMLIEGLSSSGDIKLLKTVNGAETDGTNLTLAARGVHFY